MAASSLMAQWSVNPDPTHGADKRRRRTAPANPNAGGARVPASPFQCPWLLELSYSSISRIVKDLGCDGREERAGVRGVPSSETDAVLGVPCQHPHKSSSGLRTPIRELDINVNGARKVRRVSAPEGALEKCGISPENGHVCRYERVDTNTTTAPCQGREQTRDLAGDRDALAHAGEDSDSFGASGLSTGPES
jgi:hypothetical protein